MGMMMTVAISITMAKMIKAITALLLLFIAFSLSILLSTEVYNLPQNNPSKTFLKTKIA